MSCSNVFKEFILIFLVFFSQKHHVLTIIGAFDIQNCEEIHENSRICMKNMKENLH